jgi:hypothetical protein
LTVFPLPFYKGRALPNQQLVCRLVHSVQCGSTVVIRSSWKRIGLRDFSKLCWTAQPQTFRRIERSLCMYCVGHIAHSWMRSERTIMVMSSKDVPGSRRSLPQNNLLPQISAEAPRETMKTLRIP